MSNKILENLRLHPLDKYLELQDIIHSESFFARVLTLRIYQTKCPRLKP